MSEEVRDCYAALVVSPRGGLNDCSDKSEIATSRERLGAHYEK